MIVQPATALRRLEWPADLAKLALLNTSFVTNAVYDVQRVSHGFSLTERALGSVLHKRYSPDWSELADAEYAIVSELDDAIVGVASMVLEAWNRRAVVSHLYVDAAARRQGIGARLLEKLRAHALTWKARCLFAETQNVNLPAIRFYARHGFTLVGLDLSLYDAPFSPAESALYFAEPLDRQSDETPFPISPSD